MKHFHLSLLILMLFLVNTVKAAETEPNNTSAQANTLALNGSNTGKINTADADWWKVTTTADGKLSLTLTKAGTKSVALALYDNNGTTVLTSSTSTTTFTKTMDGLAAGTYFIKLNASSSTDTLSYTLSNSLVLPAQANDAEPNNASSAATVIANNSTKTGHVGYYYNLKRDTSDWYKITTTSIKKLKLNLKPASGQSLTMSLYAGNAKSLIKTISNSLAFSITTDGLEPDNYYVKINATSSNGFSPYTFADSIFTSTNDSLYLPLNYRISDKIDPKGDVDWYRLTTTADGKLDLTLAPQTSKYIWVYLYDHNRTTLINSTYSNSKFTLSTDGLAEGTYYAKVIAYYATDTLKYQLADTLHVPAESNDAVANESKVTATTFNLNSSTKGHTGYYYNNKRDSVDWYKITLNGDGLLNLKLKPVNGQYVWIYLYDNNGTTLINSTYSNAEFNMATDGLAAGTYYIRVNCYYNTGFTPYVFTNTLVKPVQANDTEPNSKPSEAVSLAVNSTKTGHTGYYYNLKRDTADWYKITTTTDGMIKLKLTPHNGSYVWMYLYDNNGTTLLNSTYSNAAYSMNTDGLAAGTYYLKVNCYYNTGFTPYTLTDSLITYSYANDAEPNKRPYQAKDIAANSTVTGHSNFYYKLQRDSVDWWKLNYTGSGNLKFTVKLQPNKADGKVPYMWVYLYKDTTKAPIFSQYSNIPTTDYNLTGITKGTHYILLVPYYPSDFAAYSFGNTFSASGPVSTNSSLKAPAGDASESLSAAVSVYPNPAPKKFNIRAAKNIALTSAMLVDNNDRIVWQDGNMKLSQGKSKAVDVSRLPAGIYLLKITTGDKTTITKTIVITR